MKDAIPIFEAFAQETRLKVFRLLVAAGPKGLPAGQISQKLEMPHNSLSFHLGHLSRAGILDSERQGRSIVYSVDFTKVNELIRFLVQDCCGSTVANDVPLACDFQKLGDFAKCDQ
ncbi:ArsR/SmtB family transcription factor [Polycladidibacter stylochi]|uniref:ArsR/SmtB family transcription factor n=1 Tax=Polycladidibacter stylochi TaxID=1807766 RepID=UPI000A7121C9|nr:metalloregulator ArsR/SmtB family transcription factor [Pseudovibrio stylochi]